jgi:hypothetical protein
MRRDAGQSVDLTGIDQADRAPASSSRRGPFRLSTRVLDSPAYRRLWLSGIIYYSARWVEIITSGWIVLEITGSPFLVGLSGFFRVIPMLILGSLFGALADRFRRIDILIGIHVVGLLAALFLMGVFMLGIESIWIMYLLIVCIGCGSAADFSARSTLISEIQERSLLANSMSLESLSMNGAKISAAIGAGVLLAVGGPTLGYGCLAILYGCGLTWLLVLKRHLPMPVPQPQAESLRVISTLHTGWASALRIPVVRGVFIVTIIMNVMIFPYQQLIAIVAGDILSVGPFWMGVLAGADGIGAALTSARLAFGSGAKRPGMLFAGGSAAAAGLLVALALSPIFVASLLIQLVLGVCAGLFGAHQSALVLTATPVEARARALGLIATAIGMTPIGMLVIGGMSSTIGAQPAIAMMGSLGLIGLLIVFSVNSQLRVARVA